MIYFDEDSDARFFQPEAGTMTAQDLEIPLDFLKETAVRVYIVGVNAQMANFSSKVVESYLDGFDIRLGLEQPALRGNRKPWAYRRRANMSVLETAGIDSNAYLIEGARRRGIAPWIGIRMNDMHDGHDENSQIHSSFWRENPELRSPGNIPCENGFDYTHERVRKMFADFTEEVYLRYSPDNILLDWLRWPAFLPRGTGKERAHLITAMLRGIRERLGMPFACRVPLTPETALNLGLDVAAWIKEGLLTHLFIGNFFCAAEFDAPVERWREIAGSLPIIVSVEAAGGAGPGLRHKTITPEEARAIAAAAYWRGANGVHPFNYMSFIRPGKFIETGKQLFNELDSPEKLYSLPRRVYSGWNDSDVHLGDLDQISRISGYLDSWRENNSTPQGALPRTGPAEFTLHTAKAPDHDAMLTTDATGTILVNGHTVTGPSPIRIPAEWLRDGKTIINTNSTVTELYIDL